MRDESKKYAMAPSTPRDLVVRLERVMPKLERSQLAQKWFEQRGLEKNDTITTGRRLMDDLTSMHVGYNNDSWDEPYLDSGELENWRDALVLRPQEYGIRGNGEGWGLVDHSVTTGSSKVPITSFVPNNVDRIVKKVIGSPPVAQALAWAKQTEVPQIAHASFQDVVVPKLERYHSQNPEATFDNLRADLGASSAHVGDIPLGRVAIMETSFHRHLVTSDPIGIQTRQAVESVLGDLVTQAQHVIEQPDYGNGEREQLLKMAETDLRSTFETHVVYKVDDVDSLVAEVVDKLSICLPRPRVADGSPRLHKRLLDQGKLAALKISAMMHKERRAHDRHGLKKIFGDIRTNRFVRLIPNGPGRALSVSEKEVHETLVGDYRLVDRLPLFLTPTAIQLERLAYVINEAQKSDGVITIFVPTCPCDEIEPDKDGLIKFTGRSLIDGVSWTGLNTIDGLSALIPRLQRNVEGLRVNLVFATGDFEWKSGSKRGMTEEGFISQITRNHHQLWGYLRDKWGLKENTIISNPNRGASWATDVVRADLTETDGIKVSVGGLMTFSGGVDRWDQMREEFKVKVESYFDNIDNIDDIKRLMKARRPIYESLQTGKKSLSDEDLVAALKRDALDYCAAHMLSLTYPNSIVVAGDSRPMEELASAITGTLLFSIEGGYRGSRYDE